jgi:hypothetical protein
MTVLQRIGKALAGMMLAASILALATPKTVHAMVAALVRDVDNPARLPTASANCFGQNVTASGNPNFVGCFTNYSIPMGQRLVIEDVDASCSTPPGNSFFSASLDYQAEGAFFGTSHPLVLSAQGPGRMGYLHYVANQTVRYYVDAGSTISFDAATSDSSGGSVCTFQLSGYLISYP